MNLGCLLLVSLYCVVIGSGRHFEGRKKPDNFGYKPLPKEDQPFYIEDESQLPQNVLSMDDLPDSIDWRDYNGQNYVSWSRNQHMPYYCGSCWAFSTTSALSDRYMIRRGNAFPKIALAPQVLLDCDHVDFGCHGGDAAAVHNYIYENGITDETCSAYIANSWEIGTNCSDSSYCKNCASSDEDCFAVDSSFYQVYGISTYGFVSGEESMMKELTRGPITCAMAVTDEFYYDYDGGIFIDTTDYTEIDHLISIVGYGYDSESDTKYWIGRNSWGTFWGESGFFQIIRGVDNLAIEEDCYWAEPDTSNFEHLADYEWARWTNSDNDDTTNTNINMVEQTDLIEDEKSMIITNEKSGLSFTVRRSDDLNYIPSTCCGLLEHDDEHKKPEFIVKSPLPSDYVDDDDLPSEFSWHNVNGINLLSTPRNQHIPTYCGSCWAFSAISVVSDRLNILRYQSDESIWPEINLSPQALINAESAGTCSGGWPSLAFKYIESNGLPDETCQIYQAVNSPHGVDSDLDICYNCDSLDYVLWPGDCYEITDFTTYTISEYGEITSGATDMKKEIYSRGPIECGMYATGSFWHYQKGIYSDSDGATSTNHAIAVVGWGYDEITEKEYWIARNSWGMYWGEDGFFRMEMYENNLNIEETCYWAVPDYDTTAEDSSFLTLGETISRMVVHSLM